MRDDINQNAPASNTNNKSSKKILFIDQVPILPIAANAAVPSSMQIAVTDKTSAKKSSSS